MNAYNGEFSLTTFNFNFVFIVSRRYFKLHSILGIYFDLLKRTRMNKTTDDKGTLCILCLAGVALVPQIQMDICPWVLFLSCLQHEHFVIVDVCKMHSASLVI